MTDYISREAALLEIEEWADTFCECDYVWPHVIKSIKKLPAADVRPVVLCRDCGHWNKENQHPSKRSRNSVAMCAWFSRNYGTIETSEGDWCSYGYRREDSE